ncbi:hypothetical protein [Natronosalvus vescus]|uniref:hypothetical protein n=1 Tax=Natronosalvus vescus TaxID=2953881 RepID=UPI002090D20E|nr:hypothetical protein [Natronosalvus vescus]
MSSNECSRRRVIRLGSAATVVTLLAGCAGPGDDGEPEAEEGTGNGQDREEEDDHEAVDDDDDGDDDDVAGTDDDGTDAEEDEEEDSNS